MSRLFSSLAAIAVHGACVVGVWYCRKFHSVAYKARFGPYLYYCDRCDLFHD